VTVARLKAEHVHIGRWEISRTDREMKPVVTALAEIRATEAEIREELRWTREIATRVEDAVAAGGSLNQLGELHRHAIDLDRAIAQRATAWRLLGAMLTEAELAAFRADLAAAAKEEGQ